MKQENVLERVYNPGRLRIAWRQEERGRSWNRPDETAGTNFLGRFHQETS